MENTMWVNPVPFRRSSFVVALLVVACIAGPSALASDTSLPEVGAEITGNDRAKFNDLLNCALDELPEPYKKQLAHCKGKASTFALHHFNTDEQPHWKHGNPTTPEGQGTAFGPHATPEQIQKCALCILVNLEFLCEQIAAANDASNPNREHHKAFVKRILRHELVHMTQYNVWPLWRIRNEDIFNHPWSGNGPADGRNGNPPAAGDPYTPEHLADKCARQLFDCFDDLRSELTELQAVVFGNTQAGCLQPWGHFEPYEEKGETKDPFVDEVIASLQDAKKKLFGDPEDPGSVGQIGAAQQKIDFVESHQGDTAPYAKLQGFIDRLNAQKERMCQDIDQAIADAERAKDKAEDD